MFRWRWLGDGEWKGTASLLKRAGERAGSCACDAWMPSGASGQKRPVSEHKKHVM
jgi:hypothetical protein